MENASKLMMIGFMAALFASAVLLTLFMYYGVIDVAECVSDRQLVRSAMEDAR